MIKIIRNLIIISILVSGIAYSQNNQVENSKPALVTGAEKTDDSAKLVTQGSECKTHYEPMKPVKKFDLYDFLQKNPKMNKYKGQVSLILVVDEYGKVKSVELGEVTAVGIPSQPIIDEAYKVTFSPEIIDCKAVSDRYGYIITFGEY